MENILSLASVCHDICVMNLLYLLAGIAVPNAGDASFISYKCSLHDFCQQCNILPPRFSTSKHESGYGSSVNMKVVRSHDTSINVEESNILV